MIKKKSNRVICCILMITLLLLSASTSAFAEINVGSSSKLNSDYINVSRTIAQLDDDIEISDIVVLHDFDGNQYSLVECFPKGYMIYSTDTKIIMEYSVDSVSPYHGYEGDLRYCGPTQYYYYNDEAKCFEHTVLGHELMNEEVIAAKQISKQAQSAFHNMKLHNASSSTISSETINSATMAESKLATIDAPAAVNAATTYIGNNRSFFTNLNTSTKMGYYSPAGTDGICGYVAAGIVLLYYDYCLNKDYIPSGFLNSTGNAFNGTSFTRHLYEDIGKSILGYSSGTNASQVANVMKTYLSVDRNISVTTWSTFGVRVEDIIYQLKNRQIPVVYVNRFVDPQNSNGDTTDHDIVVYGYDSSNNLHAHFGWTGYTDVVCSSPATAVFLSSACAITYY